ncbi:MAG: YfhO family protein, partial [Candidatus Omnitrophica bacterium]|nr:YfhO family protein [Candidatus Omnitrophota bacterium]
GPTWTTWLGIALAASALGWLMYAASGTDLQRYLQTNGFSEPVLAEQIQRFSLMEVGWYIFFFVLAFALITLILSRALSGSRARWAWIALAVLLVADLARANSPWIIYYNYKLKYADNPVFDIMRDKPYEHRVSIMPLDIQPLPMLNNLYIYQWLQQQFQYYNIQSSDIIQEPRTLADNAAYRAAFSRSDLADLLRLWQLTNTKYLLGLGGNFVDVWNKQVDPEHHGFQLKAAFDLVPKPGAETDPKKMTFDDLTAEIKPDGRFGLIEFTNALPRAQLFAHWQINTNDQAALDELANPGFDPTRTVLVTRPTTDLPAPGSTNQNAGSVAIKHYAPKDVRLEAKVDAPAVLLLNDKYDRDWKVQVDGRPAPVLRCNYIMRGVFLKPGSHTIEFRYLPPVTSLYISLAAWVLGLGICGFLAASRKAGQGPSDTGGDRTVSSGQPAEAVAGGRTTEATRTGPNRAPRPPQAAS